MRINVSEEGKNQNERILPDSIIRRIFFCDHGSLPDRVSGVFFPLLFWLKLGIMPVEEEKPGLYKKPLPKERLHRRKSHGIRSAICSGTV